MKNFSGSNIEDLLKTGKDRTIDIVRSMTGLPDDQITQIYEAKKEDNVSDEGIVSYFEKISTPKEVVNVKEFFGSLVGGLSGTENKLSDIQKTGITKGILSALNDFSSGADNKIIDSAEMMTIVKGLLEIKNPKAKGLLSTSEDTLVLEPISHDWGVLNEAITLKMPEAEKENTVQLYEGIKQILSRNTRRWGNSYRLKNSYEAIMEYVDEEIASMKLDQSIVSIDDGFHMQLLNEFISGQVNPIYKSINGIRQLIPDIQTLVFDMVLLTNHYIERSSWALEFIAKVTVNEYRDSARHLLASIASSRLKSKIINDELLNRESGKNIDRDQVELSRNPDCMPENEPMGPGSFLQEYTNAIDHRKLNYEIWNMPIKAVTDIIWLTKSTGGEFNLLIRPFIKNWVTKSLELMGSVERARRESSTFNR